MELRRPVSWASKAGLIRRYLESGMMVGGLVEQRAEGTPRGGPLSAFLSNILLDDFDQEPERHSHRSWRDADDGNVYLKSARAGERVMASRKAFLAASLRKEPQAVFLENRCPSGPGNVARRYETVNGTGL